MQIYLLIMDQTTFISEWFLKRQLLYQHERYANVNLNLTLNSGGQKRRVSMAAAMIHNPPLLVLGEPCVGLDPLLRQRYIQHLHICGFMFMQFIKEENAWDL